MESIRKDAAKTDTEMADAVKIQQRLSEESARQQEKLVGRMGDLITAINNMDLIMPAAIIGAVVAGIGAAFAGGKLLQMLSGPRGTPSTGPRAGGGGAMSRIGGLAMRMARFAGPLGAAALGIYGASQGIGKAAEYFDLAEGESATFGQKLSSGIGGAVQYLSLGLADGEWVANSLHNMGESLGNGFKAVGGAVTNFFNDPQGTMKDLGDSVHAGFTAATNFVNSAWTGMKESALGEAITDSFNSAKDFVTNSWDSAKETMDSWGKSIADGWSSAKNFVSSSWDTATEKMSEWGTSLSEGYEDLKGRVSERFNSARDTVKEWGASLSEGYENLRNRASGVVSSAINTARDLAPKIQQSLSNAADAASNAVSSGWKKVTGFFSRSPAELVDAVQDQPIVSTADSISDAVAGTTGAAGATQMNSESLLSSLNTKLDELIRVANMLNDTNERQLTVQRSMSGDLLVGI